MLTFAELKTLAYGQLGYGQGGTSVPTDPATRVSNYLNECVRRILADPEFNGLRNITLPFNSVASQKLYAIPEVFSRVRSIVQQTNDRKLGFMTFQQFRAIDPAERATGTPDSYVEYGRTVFFAQPAVTGTGLWAVSTSNSDTTQTLYFQGVRLNGDTDPERSITLNGSTRRQIGSLTDYIAGTKLGLSATAVGAVSIYDAATNGNELARIPIGKKSVFGLLFRLWPTPSSALSYLIDGEIKITDMVHDSDVPFLPEDFQDLPSDYAVMRQLAKDGGQAYADAAQRYNDRKSDLRISIQFPDDYRPVAGSISTAGRISTLGAWFPTNNNWP